MTAVDIARRLLELDRHIERFDPAPAGTRREDIVAGVVRTDAARQTPFPSSSGNVTSYLGIEGEVAKIDLNRLREHYHTACVTRFFLSVSPSVRLRDVLADAERAGFAPFGGTSYPTLARALGGAIEDVSCSFDVRALSAAEMAASAFVDPALGRAAAAGDPSLAVFGAFDGSALVATASCRTVGEMCYLSHAQTAETFRGRGAQSALIRRRLLHGQERGATMAVAETLGMLTTSLGNLQRAGFDVIYNKTVLDSAPV